MDIFNSALKNPVPPLIKKEEEKLESEAALKRKKTSRRKHRNSHLGCGTCKKRRIKCDENLPSCLNCLKGKLHCAYLNLDSNARNALRMAQYNQHLRQDRPDNEKSPQSNTGGTNSSSASPNEVLLNTNAPQTTFTVPYPIIQTTATPVNMPQQAHVIQSPYGPLVSLQPMQQQMTNMAIPYPQVPMVQSAVPLIYSNAQPMAHMQNGHPIPSPSVSVAPPSEMNSGTPPVSQSMRMQSMSTPMMNTMKEKDLALPPIPTIPQSNTSASLRTSPKLSSANHSVSYNSLPSINSEYKIKQLTDNSIKNSPILPPLKNSHNNNNSPNANAEESDKNPKISKLLS